MEYSRKFFAATFLVVVFSISSVTNAALVGRLDDGFGNWQAYYDDVADLTWLADAKNYRKWLVYMAKS